MPDSEEVVLSGHIHWFTSKRKASPNWSNKNVQERKYELFGEKGNE